MGFMSVVFQIQPTDETSNVIAFDPSRRSRMSIAADRRLAERRPVRARSLAIALAVGALIGTLVSLSAVDAGAPPLTGDEVKTELVAR